MSKRALFLLLLIVGAKLLLITLTLQMMAGMAEANRSPENNSHSAAGMAIEESRSPAPDLPNSATLLFEDRPPTGFGGGGWDGVHDHLSLEQEQAIETQIAENIQLLTAQKLLPPVRSVHVSLAWPLRPSDRSGDYSYYGISNFVDHNPHFPNQLLDYHCGQRTYDTTSGYNHRGVDIFTWPFPWNKMDDDEVEVIAAAPGVIVYKQDGHFDRSCSFNDNPWNAVYVRHGDGSVAWYGHLKNGSVTGKPVGSTVLTGEYLGVVGSSGNSTGPHLHFELRDVTSQLIDPYWGSCNSLNGSSWWADQTAYYDPAVNKVTTGWGAPSISTCGAPENGRIKDDFSPGDLLYLTTYYRDQLAGQPSHYAIIQPDNDIYQSWSHSSAATHYAASWWWWSFLLPSDVMTGTWRFTVDFADQQVETHFNVGVPTQISVTLPLVSEAFQPGLIYTVTWAANLGGNVRLELHRNEVYLATLANSLPNNGAYAWTIPLDSIINPGYRIRVVNLANTAVYGETAPFTIGEPHNNYLPAIQR